MPYTGSDNVYVYKIGNIILTLGSEALSDFEDPKLKLPNYINALQEIIK